MILIARLTAWSTVTDLYLDTGGLFALLVPKDPRHAAAAAHIQSVAERRRRLLVTDYVLDEAATLLKVRGLGHVTPALFSATMDNPVCEMAWTGPERFRRARQLFESHHDHGYSFTDCVSFTVMREAGVDTALASDRHFVEAGFRALLV